MMKKKPLSMLIAGLMAVSHASWAAPRDEIVSTASDQHSVAVTIYNDNLGLVKDVRAAAGGTFFALGYKARIGLDVDHGAPGAAGSNLHEQITSVQGEKWTRAQLRAAWASPYSLPPLAPVPSPPACPPAPGQTRRFS